MACRADQGGTLSPEEEAKIAKINQLHDAEQEKWNKLRAAVAAKNRELMMIQRRIDEIPTRAELLQVNNTPKAGLRAPRLYPSVHRRGGL